MNSFRCYTFFLHSFSLFWSFYEKNLSIGCECVWVCICAVRLRVFALRYRCLTQSCILHDNSKHVIMHTRTVVYSREKTHFFFQKINLNGTMIFFQRIEMVHIILYLCWCRLWVMFAGANWSIYHLKWNKPNQSWLGDFLFCLCLHVRVSVCRCRCWVLSVPWVYDSFAQRVHANCSFFSIIDLKHVKFLCKNMLKMRFRRTMKHTLEHCRFLHVHRIIIVSFFAALEFNFFILFLANANKRTSKRTSKKRFSGIACRTKVRTAYKKKDKRDTQAQKTNR